MEAASQGSAGRTRRQIAVLFAIGLLVVTFLIAARGAVGPFLVALLVAFFMAPVVDGLERRRVPRSAGILICYAVIVLVAIVALSYVVPRLAASAAALEGVGRSALEALPGWLAANGAPPEVVAAAESAIAALQEAADQIGTGGMLGPMVDVVTSVLGTLLSFAFAPFFIFYLVADKRGVMRAFDRGLPPDWRGDVWAVIGIATRALRQWLRATGIQGVIMAGLSLVSMIALSFVFGSPFADAAIVIAVIAGLSEFIPIIGPIFPLIGATLVGISVSPAAAISAFIVFAILQQLEANVVAPRVEGEALSLHPALIIAVLILGSAAAGLMGALLATVVTSTVLIVGRYLFRRASGLIDPPPPPAAPEYRPLDGGAVPGVPRMPAADRLLAAGSEPAGQPEAAAAQSPSS